jgi:GAF domain-containing protein/HAMP domain-containing protein
MKLNLSLGQRLNLTFGGLILMVILAAGVGVWYITSVSQAVQTGQASVAQIEKLANLQFVWSEVATGIDNMLLTRQVSLGEREIQGNLVEFNRQLEDVGAAPFGQSAAVAAKNQATVDELELLGAELDDIVQEMITQAQQRRWVSAQALRHTELASFQRRFDERLVQLSDSTQQEAERLVAQAARAQQIARNIWVATVLAAIVLGVAASILTIRSITHPIRGLIEQAKRVTKRDFSPISPLTQGDEIGELSRTFALMTDWLRDSYQTLEDRVAQRTLRLEIVATLSEYVNSLLNVEEVLQTVVDQTRVNFDFYHVHIYLFDDRREHLVVAAGTGAAGAEMKSRGHSIGVLDTSLVSRAARLNEVVLVEDVRAAADWLPNPLLPDTRSEMAVPIAIEGRVVGVLDVQSDKVRGMDEADANLVRSLANQVAVAIRNARLFESVEAALAEAHAAQARYTVQSWERRKITERGGQHLFVRDDTNISEAARGQIIASATKEAVLQDGPELVTIQLHDDLATQTLVTPVVLRDTNLGTVQLHAPGRSWSEDDMAVIQVVVDQLAQTAENVRLFEETRERASQEQTIRQITDRMRSANNLENLITITVQELGDRLQAGRTVVRFEDVEPISSEELG